MGAVQAERRSGRVRKVGGVGPLLVGGGALLLALTGVAETSGPMDMDHRLAAVQRALIALVEPSGRQTE